MSTFSSDRIANIIVPDLQKRFRRGYIDYFNREDKTYRPVEEVQIRSIVPLEQFEELMKLLDDIVLFSAATPELATKFQGLWNRLDLPDKDDKDRIECTRMGLISLESYIKVFIYLLCGNGDLLRQIEAEKHVSTTSPATDSPYAIAARSTPSTGTRSPTAWNASATGSTSRTSRCG